MDKTPESIYKELCSLYLKFVECPFVYSNTASKHCIINLDDESNYLLMKSREFYFDQSYEPDEHGRMRLGWRGIRFATHALLEPISYVEDAKIDDVIVKPWRPLMNFQITKPNGRIIYIESEFTHEDWK